MVLLALGMVSNMAIDIKTETIVTPGKRPVEVPTIDTPIKQPQTPIVFDDGGVTQRISFEGQEYEFPADTSDDEMLGFLNNIPAEEVIDEEPSEPLREEAIIKKDEGVKKDKDDNHVAYMDSVRSKKHPKGILTGGRGHQLTKEEKKLYPIGTVIPNDVVDAWFKEDMIEADEALTRILEKKATHVPDEVYDILLNMSFNLGQKGLLTFKDMWAAIEVEDWATAAVEMEDSKWFKQVKNRAVRLVSRMKALAPKSEEASAEEDLVLSAGLTPAKAGLFEDENGTLFKVDAQGNKTEV